MASVAAPEDQAALKAWRDSKSLQEKEALFDQLIRDGILPPDVVSQWEVGLYPDMPQMDEQFIPKLMRKREFLDTTYEVADVEPCRSTEGFELTSTQRFVSTFLSPRTPYNGMLLYHGVGVGKTCAAVTTCEAWLELNPKRAAYIVAPPTIQEGFLRTIFDPTALVMGTGTQPNRHNGCTGDLYLSLTGMLYEKDAEKIKSAVSSLVRKRYKLFGYYAFYKEIVRTKQSVATSAAGSEQVQLEQLRNVFSNRMLVIDEAHNLRDAPDEGSEESVDDTSQEIQGSAEGKKLTPMLKEVLKVSEGIKLLLMTATPMYNSYKEILFLLDLLRMNDIKQSSVRFDDIFVANTSGGTSDFEFKPTGRRLLGGLASAYISFMRGENPASFPIRLEPQTSRRLTRWPTKTPKGETITAGSEVSRLPCVGCHFSRSTEEFYKSAATEAVSREGLSITTMDKLIQGGNWLFPVPDAAYEDRIQQIGFDGVFEKVMKGTVAQYRDVDEERHSSWLLETALPEVSGKAAYVVKRLAKTKGVAFVYSRFVATGALTLALALEANGYTSAGDVPLLADGIQHPEGRQCALCENHEKTHKGQDHTFVAAKYILLTGSVELTPNTKVVVDAARAKSNMYGADVKVVVGSQIAGEGLDLRYIREIFVFDGWYHLNKLEQVIGRGVRNCSHAGLPKEKRNTTITLLVNAYANTPSLESVDAYSYRTALLKASVIGKVSRVLKEYAMDCALTRDAVVLKDLDRMPAIDGQGVRRTTTVEEDGVKKEVDGVNVNDVPFTALCDWLDRCTYDCLAPTGTKEVDYSTYDDYTLRYKEKQVRKVIEDMIVNQGQMSIRLNEIESSLQYIPSGLLLTLINDILDKDFIIQTKAGSGRVVMKNQFLVFEPEVFRGLTIPTAVRMLPVPVKRDAARYEPVIEEQVEEVQEEGEGDSETLWDAAVAWSKAIRDGSAAGVPADVKNELPSVATTSVHQNEILERLGSIVWLYESVRDSEARVMLADVVLEYFWDEIITLPTRRALLTTGAGEGVAADSFWELEGTQYLRLHNTDTGDTEYFTVSEDGRAVPTIKSVEEILRREKAGDPLLKPVDTTRTGYHYGFLVQRGPRDLVFKVTAPPEVGKRVGRGSACSSSSAVKPELAQLERLGAILQKDGKPDLGLNALELGGRRAIRNANRICSLSDLVLRWMDKSRVQGKRWFYRALESKLTGHRNR